MKVLLAGGAGYIGSHTCIELVNAGFEPVIVDDFANSSPIAVKRIEEITGRKIRLYTIDVCNEEELEKVFKENEIGSIVHFAGYKAVGESVKLPLKYYRNNLDSTFALLSLCEKYDVNSFIFSSSATVYGMSEDVPYHEDLPTGCLNPYGWTKYMNEQILRDYAKVHPSFSTVLLRYFNPIGAHEAVLSVTIRKAYRTTLCRMYVRSLQASLKSSIYSGMTIRRPTGPASGTTCMS